MTELYVFSNDSQENSLIQEGNEREEPMKGGGISITKWFQQKTDVLNDSQQYSFFDHLAIPLGLQCFHTDSLPFNEKSIDEEDEPIQDHVFDRLFFLSAKETSDSKKRTTRKKNRKTI
jgi:hypothetical protein